MTAIRDRALHALRSIAAQMEPVDDPLPCFYGRLSQTLARLVGGGRAGIFRLQGDSLSLQAEAFGIEAGLAAALQRIPCRPGGDSALEGVVFRDESFRAGGPVGTRDGERHRSWLDALGARDAAAVPWGVGGVRLGLVAAWDSASPAGFTDDDVWVLQVAAGVAALASQQRDIARARLARQTEESRGLRDVAARMTELEELKRHILNLAAHELRGPLAVVRGYISMVADGSLDATGLRRILPILVGKTAQMDGLITQMLEVARLEEGRLELAQQTVDLADRVRATVDVAALLAPPGLRVFMAGPPLPVLVQADGERVATIVANLVDNAIKYSPQGGLVHCTVGATERRAFVEVKDSGLGIAAVHLPRLFSRFGRIVTPENSHISGTGLGLHLSRELARMQGGDIDVHSEPGRGSTFTLWLPLEAAAAAEPAH